MLRCFAMVLAGVDGRGLTENAVTEQWMGASVVAAALRNGSIDALLELADVLEMNGTKETARNYVLQVICVLLPDEGQDGMLAGPQILPHKNVIDLFTRRCRD